MSLHVTDSPAVPEDTARVAEAIFPQSSPYMTVREELGPLYSDAAFADLFALTGRPAEAPGRLAVVLVLQVAEGLSDRQAADQVRSRIDWKYLLGLGLSDRGFHYSVLSRFRTRLVAGGREQPLLEEILARFKTRGLLKAGGRQRTDSTHVLAAIRTLNRLECVGETLRHTLNVLARVAPAWVQQHVPAEWSARYPARFEQYRLPPTEAARQALADTIGTDGDQLLQWALAPEAPAVVRQQPAVAVLRQVWVQQYEQTAGQVRWRAAANLPPGAQLIQSPYDPEARYSRKRNTTWTGYKVHLTETCAPAPLYVLTHVATTPAPVPDIVMTAPIQTALVAQGIAPQEHVVDQGYVDADLVVRSQTERGIELVGPVPADTSWQTRAAQGFALAAFQIDWAQHQVTCPRGHVSQVWGESHDSGGTPVIHVRFAPAACRVCPARAQCTRAQSGPRALKLRPQAQHEVLQQARQQQLTPEFKARYAARAGVEGTVAQGTRAFGMRRTCYRGQAKTHLHHLLAAVAMNLARFVNWVTGVPLAPTRTSAFAALAAT